MEIGDDVIANRDGKTFTKGTKGTIERLGTIDSEVYIFVRTEDGQLIGPSVESYWNSTE